MTTLERERILTIVNVQEELPPQRVEALAAAHPNLPILMRNVKWELQRQTVPLLFHCENLHLGFDACQIHQGIEWLAERGCADRLLLTSNAPDMAMGAHRAYIDWAELPRETKQKIAGGNLTRLLHGQAPETTRENVDEDALMAEARRGAPLSARVLDAHAHMLDEGLNGGGGRHVMPAGGPSGVRRLAERLGVDGIGIMSWNGITVPDPDDGNRCVRDALDAHPGFYWGLATFDPVHDDAGTQRAKMEELFADERFLGFKPYTTFGLSYDDPKYEPWWRFGDERGLYAGLHPNRWDLAEFDALCPSYPNMTFVAFHCGRSYATADAAIEMARKHDNFRAEITLTPVCMGIIDYLVAGCGADRVLYGTDLPMRDPRQQLGWVVYSRLPVEEKKRVLGANAQALIDRVRAARAAAPGRSGSGTGSSRDG
jgi:predicted TIM-barrel fold metal-dependent hydrolase